MLLLMTVMMFTDDKFSISSCGTVQFQNLLNTPVTNMTYDLTNTGIQIQKAGLKIDTALLGCTATTKAKFTDF